MNIFDQPVLDPSTIAGEGRRIKRFLLDESTILFLLQWGVSGKHPRTLTVPQSANVPSTARIVAATMSSHRDFEVYIEDESFPLIAEGDEIPAAVDKFSMEYRDLILTFPTRPWRSFEGEPLHAVTA